MDFRLYLELERGVIELQRCRVLPDGTDHIILDALPNPDLNFEGHVYGGPQVHLA